jgi:hypothetical protein
MHHMVLLEYWQSISEAGWGRLIEIAEKSLEK